MSDESLPVAKVALENPHLMLDLNPKIENNTSNQEVNMVSTNTVKKPVSEKNKKKS